MNGKINCRLCGYKKGLEKKIRPPYNSKEMQDAKSCCTDLVFVENINVFSASPDDFFSCRSCIMFSVQLPFPSANCSEIRLSYCYKEQSSWNKVANYYETGYSCIIQNLWIVPNLHLSLNYSLIVLLIRCELHIHMPPFHCP